jgi:hypothetical protein
MDGTPANLAGSTGILSGGTSFAVGMAGQALSLDGSGRVTLNVGTATPLLTVEAWIKPIGTQLAHAIIAAQSDSYSLEVTADRAGVQMRLHLAHGEWIAAGGGVLAFGEWNHVAAAFDGATLRVYLNGELVGSHVMAGTVFPSATNTAIGGVATGDGFNGLIDEPAIFARALSEREVAAIWVARTGGKCTAFDSSLPPTVIVPANLDIAAGPAGTRTVNFVARAFDNSDGEVPVQCVPASGAVFPSGTTVVACTASDSEGQPAGASFSVRVGAVSSDLPNPIGWWKFDEGQGAVAIDSSGSGRDGTITGGMYVDAGLARGTPNPSALRLDGEDGRVVIADDSRWNLDPTNAKTFSMWVTLRADRGIYHVFGKREGCGGDPFFQLARDGRGFFFMTDGGAAVASRTLQVGLTTLVTVTYDRGTLRLYLDGVMAGRAFAPMSGTRAVPLLLGTSGTCPPSEALPAIIDDVRIYDRALSAEQVLELFDLVPAETYHAHHASPKRINPVMDPALTWPGESFYIHATLDPALLNAQANIPGTSANIPGTFTYSPGAGAVVGVGWVAVSAHFEPLDGENYRSAGIEKTFFAGAFPLTLPTTAAQTSPYGGSFLAFDSSRSRFYVGAPQSDPDAAVLVLDPGDYRLLGRLVIGSSSELRVQGVAVDEVRNRVLVSGGGDSLAQLWIFDATTLSLIETLNLPYPIGSPAVNPATGRVYLTSRSQDASTQVIVALDLTLAGNSGWLETIGVAVCGGVGLGRLEVNEITNVLYIGGDSATSCRLTAIDVDPARSTFHTVLRELDSGPSSAFAINRKKHELYRINGSSDQLQVIDGDPASPTFHTVKFTTTVDVTGTGLELAHLWQNLSDGGIAMNPNTNRLYVQFRDQLTGMNLAGLFAVDTEQFEVVGTRVMSMPEGSTFADVMVDPVRDRLYLRNDATVWVFDERVTETMPTQPSGLAPVIVQSPQGAVTFSSVLAAGVTEIEPVDTEDISLPMPGGFSVDGVRAFEVSTTAVVTSPITLCFNVSSVTDPVSFAQLRVLHGENGALVDRTSSRDFSTGSVCATVSSLSPFVIARQLEPQYQVSATYDATKSFKAGRTAPIKIRVLNESGANVSSAAVRVHAVELIQTSTNATAVIADAGNSNPDSDFRFDVSQAGYVFNLKTTGSMPGSYELRVTVGDGLKRYSVPLQIR